MQDNIVVALIGAGGVLGAAIIAGVVEWIKHRRGGSSGAQPRLRESNTEPVAPQLTSIQTRQFPEHVPQRTGEPRESGSGRKVFKPEAAIVGTFSSSLAQVTRDKSVDPDHSSLWDFARERASRPTEDETRRIASRLLTFIVINNYTEIEILPDDYDFLRQQYQSDRDTLLSWGIQSKKVDLFAKRVRVYKGELAAFLSEEEFNVERTSNPAAQQRNVWFESCDPRRNLSANLSCVEAGLTPLDDGVRVNGCSPSTRRASRELDLTRDGTDIIFHIHLPGSSRPKLRVAASDLQAAFGQWNRNSDSARIECTARTTSNKDAIVVMQLRRGAEVEVQAGSWWIWVSVSALAEAFQKLNLMAETWL